MRKGAFGIPLYEIALVVVVAGIVLGALKWRVDYLLEQAEKVAVEVTVMNMRSGLRLEKARRIAIGQSLDDLAGVNPLMFLEAPLVGECSKKLQETSKTIKSGKWSCGRDKNEAVYIPQRQRHLKMRQEGVDKRLMWQTRLTDHDGKVVEVVLMTPYQWF
ncbi:MAG: hypothetical protein H6R19_1371 [Proteobacteria bacterium]|nr:hypothetical protein [Pseudomonadota bacterium]